jgi:hypothetical protein
MSYNIIRTDGTPLATVADGQTNSTASSLTLIGKNYAGYGTFLNENFIRLLENFSSASAPSNPLVGQLWWKSDTRLLQVYDKFGTWKSISGAQSSSDAPSNALAGDLWFDTVNQQLKVYGGASWIIIGPSFTATTGTSGAIADTIIDTSLISHVVVKFFVQNQLIGILSKDSTFTPNSTLPGFVTVKPGFNLATDRIPALTFNENANNAAYLGGIIASSYLTSTTPVVQSQIEIQNPDGLIIQETDGTVDYFEINVAANNVNLSGLLRGNGLIIRTRPDNAGGLSVNAITIDRTTGLVSVSADPTAVLGVATKGYVDTNDTQIKGFIASNVNTLNTTINTLTANTTLVYGNVRILQSELGIVGGPISGFANTTPWTQITGPAGSGGASQTIAGNIVSLWANVAAIHSNVLSSTGVSPAASASMFSNVRALQNTVSDLGTSALQRDGSRSVLGTIVPETNGVYDFGSINPTILRFRDFFGRTVNLTGNVFASGNVECIGNLISTSEYFTGIASGPTSDRPANPAAGYIRYNTTLSQFEGHNGTNWSSLGGVRSVDGFTYIQAETSAGASNGELDFYVEQTGGSTTAKAAGLNKDRFLFSVPVQATALTTGASGTGGTVTGAWTLTSGSTWQATYADLAERFAADAGYAEGTVLKLGGSAEVTVETDDASENVFGVVSHKYAYLLNSEAGNHETHPPVALAGRVPVRVIGTVTKGDRLIAAGNGCARAANRSELTAFNIVGRALEDKTTTDESLLMCVVTVNR